VRALVTSITAAMGPTPWELIFVDDDSPDGTWRAIADIIREGAPVRCIRRVGRRGLASAVVEGAMSASADIIAVIDADMQHDEKILPQMLRILQTTDNDLVIASRHVEGGGLGEWDKGRARMSALATWCSKLLIGGEIHDPMSGFFMTRRAVMDSAIYDLSQQGYKILLDILTSSPRPLKVAEVPYVFRDRLAGESKLDVMIIVEYAFLLIEKLTRGLVPARFVLFSLVGGLGLFVHLGVLSVMKSFGERFLYSQLLATLIAMTFNYVVNNSVTYRSQRLSGMRFVLGYFIFCAVCSLGALANLSVANLAISHYDSWALAGLAGAIMSAVFNFSVLTKFVWGRKRRSPVLVISETVT
jgi:dolichol-phosphate mannosyltransferase